MQVVEQARLYALDLRDLIQDVRERQRVLFNQVMNACGDDSPSESARLALEGSILLASALAEGVEALNLVDASLGRYMREF